MKSCVTIDSLERDLTKLGLRPGDTVLIRADSGTVGALDRNSLLQALLDVVGKDGTIVSLASVEARLFWKVSKHPPFTVDTPSYAGALPNAMLRHPSAFRSTHPQCSYVAIGKHAQHLTTEHGPASGAHDPVRKIIGLKGKMLLVGCVDSSPGFTTVRIAEMDLGLTRRRIAPWLSTSRYLLQDGTAAVFYRKDSGLCSKSFWKFYGHYVRHGLLSAGFVGNAYSIFADAEQCYEVEKAILERDPKFNVCESPDCVICNFLRWDRVYMWPSFAFRRIMGIHGPSKR
jgi:aminoglycoside N3'-acetyltransferase